MKSSGGGPALERKIVEKNRRIHMKSLCLKLSSLIPKHPNSSKVAMRQLDHLDQVVAYIKDIRERIERLKRWKDNAKRIEGSNNTVMTTGFRLPVIKIQDSDSSLEVVLISELNKSFLFHEIIRVLEEEGAEVLNASFSTVGDKIFHTIHSQPFCPRVGLDVVMISKRLKELID